MHHCCGALLPLFSDGSTHGYSWIANHLEGLYRLPPPLGGYLVLKTPRHYYEQRMEDSSPLQAADHAQVQLRGR